MNTSASEMPGASLEAIQQHYDVGNDFYRLWLDDSMTYSAALWDERVEDDDLASAQARKVDFHVRQARAQGAARVLDVGCGWGAVVRSLVTRHGAGKAVGLTLSQAQADWISAFGLPQVEVRVESWAQHRPAAPYDAIISIGAFEHFARWGVTRAEKVEGYRAFFKRCHEWLRPGGWMSLQSIAYGQVTSQEAIRAMPVSQFLARVIFPESDIPALPEISDATEGLFEIVQLLNHREHYARTSRVWLGNLRANRRQAVALVGETVTAQYERYLDIWANSFELGTQALLRLALRRIDRAWV